jgi:hypothetical protein
MNARTYDAVRSEPQDPKPRVPLRRGDDIAREMALRASLTIAERQYQLALNDARVTLAGRHLGDASLLAILDHAVGIARRVQSAVGDIRHVRNELDGMGAA